MGRVLLCAGSKGMAGAAALAAEASLRSGAGYAFVMAPTSIAAELTAATPSAVLRLCGNDSRSCLLLEDSPSIAELSSQVQSIVLGPGVGREPSTLQLVNQVAQEITTPLVLDADALHPDLMYPLPQSWIITPHAAEANRLLGYQCDSRQQTCQALVDKYSCVVLLKGAGTLIASPKHEMLKNSTGNPGMATAGSGDVLSGCIAGLLARGLSSFDATRLGAYLHGRAGDLAAQAVGEESLIAPDLINFLPTAIMELN